MATEYDAIYRTTKTIQPYRKVNQLFYNERNLTKTIDPRGFETRHTYDGRNLLIKTETQIDTSNYISTYATYDDEGLVLSDTDGNGNVTFYEYTKRDELEKVIAPQGRISQFFYDENGLSISSMDANGYYTRMEYDSLNRLVRSYNALDDFVEMQYDKNNNVIAVYDEMAFRDATVYDPLNRPVEMYNAVNNLIMSYEYDANSNLVRTTDANKVVSESAYDELNRLQSSDANVLAAPEFQQSSTYVYDANSNVDTVYLSNGNFYSSEYDSLDRMITTSDALGKMDSTIYDLNNNVIAYHIFTGEMDYPVDTLKTKYDGINRPIEMIDAEGIAAFTEYDDNSNVLNYTDRNGQQTQMVYDSLDQQIYVVNAKLDTTQTVYDVAGAVVQLIDDNKQATTYERDALYRIKTEIFADSSSRQYQYNPASDLIEMIDNNGVKRDFVFDERHWLTNRNYDEATPNDAFEYDAMGRMLSANNTNANIEMTYHPSTNLMEGETLNANKTQYNYDLNKRKRNVQYPNGRQVAESFDLRARLQQVKDMNGSFEANWQYDNENKMTQKSYNNGVTSYYNYTPNNWLKDLMHSTSLAAKPIAHFKHGFDKEGNKQYAEKLHHPTHSENYDYTNIYELNTFEVGTLMTDTTVTIPNPINFKNFEFDGVYNWTEVNNNGDNESYTVDAMNQYTNITKGGTSTNLQYDLNGNLLFDGNQYYQYDAENRLTKIATDAGFATIIGAYFYNAFSRRIKKQTATDTINYFYDGWRCIEEQSNSDTTTFVYGTWIDDMLNRQNNTGELFYHKNALGSVIALSDENGDVLERYEYDAYGKPIIYTADFDTLAASAVENVLMFTGRRWDAESSIYYYRYRYMHPELGRFLGRDPLGYVDGMNIRAYVGGNPMNFIDPLGEESHHWFPQSKTIKKLLELRGWGDLAKSKFINNYTTPLSGVNDLPNKGAGLKNIRIKTPHGWLHMLEKNGGYDYNLKVTKIILSSTSKCDYLIKMLNLISKTHRALTEKEFEKGKIESNSLNMYTHKQSQKWKLDKGWNGQKPDRTTNKELRDYVIKVCMEEEECKERRRVKVRLAELDVQIAELQLQLCRKRIKLSGEIIAETQKLIKIANEDIKRSERNYEISKAVGIASLIVLTRGSGMLFVKRLFPKLPTQRMAPAQ